MTIHIQKGSLDSVTTTTATARAIVRASKRTTAKVTTLPTAAAPAPRPPLPARAAPQEYEHVETQIVTITPSMACEWLERGGDNRPINQPSVNRFAQAMRDGEWRLTGESIKLDSHGFVRDGQHRLFACIESDRPFVTMVTLNVPDDAFDVMDSGRTRSNADIVALHHFTNAKQAAAVARYSLLWEMNGHPSNDGRTPISKPRILDWLRKHDDHLPEWVTMARTVCRNRIAGGEGIWGAILHILAHVDAEATREFADALISGTDLQPHDPRLVLRNRLLGETRVPPAEIAAYAIKSWNAWRKGRRVQVLRWSHQGGKIREAFPKPE